MYRLLRTALAILAVLLGLYCVAYAGMLWLDEPDLFWPIDYLGQTRAMTGLTLAGGMGFFGVALALLLGRRPPVHDPAPPDAGGDPLQDIQAILEHAPWNADTCGHIARVLIRSHYLIRHPDDPAEPVPCRLDCSPKYGPRDGEGYHRPACPNRFERGAWDT